MRRLASSIGVQPQEIAFGPAKKLAQAQIGITRNIAGSIDDGVDPIARHTDGMSQLILAHADRVQEFFLQNFAWMRITQ